MYFTFRILAGISLSVVFLSANTVRAHEILRQGDNYLNADLTAVFGLLSSEHNYDGRPGGSDWREAYVKYGLSGGISQPGAGQFHGAVNLVSSGTWGDGDPGGMSNGRERRTSLEEAYVGWRSGDLFPALGTDGVDVSLGRQPVRVGSGFLIIDDGLNPGKALAGGGFDRGGAYYLGARHAFAQTAVVRLGGSEGLHGSALWLKSDNRAQAKTELAVGTLDYTGSAGTLGLTYIQGLDVDARYASPAQMEREDIKVYSLRGEGNAGFENTRFAFEYARQHKPSGRDEAWYVQADHTFAGVSGAPVLGYRYTRYSQNWDSLFTGGFEEWLQGEVASNYPGPFNTNAGIHRVSLKWQPRENLTLKALYFDFHTLEDRETLNLDARELNLSAEWVVHDHLIVSPLVGLYKPRAHAGNGGNQSDDASTNVYTQLLFIVPF